MIDFTNFALFLAASWAMIIAPGPDMLYVITRGLSQGRAAGLLSAFGVTLGILVHTAAAACGLAAILQTSALAFAVVKYVGAAYLIYLGLKSLRDTGHLALTSPAEPAGLGSIFWQGVLSNLFNPKIALFFLAFLPQFINPALGDVPLQMISLGLIFACFGVAFLSLVALFAGSLGHWLLQNPRLGDKIRWLTACILVGLGLRLVFSKQR